MITRLRAQWMLSDLKQWQIADQLGISQSKVSAWTNGSREIPQRHIPKLCEIFQCNPQDVVGWTDEVLERGKV